MCFIVVNTTLTCNFKYLYLEITPSFPTFSSLNPWTDFHGSYNVKVLTALCVSRPDFEIMLPEEAQNSGFQKIKHYKIFKILIILPKTVVDLWKLAKQLCMHLFWLTKYRFCENINEIILVAFMLRSGLSKRILGFWGLRKWIFHSKSHFVRSQKFVYT